jgi:hypothetical protein
MFMGDDIYISIQLYAIVPGGAPMGKYHLRGNPYKIYQKYSFRVVVSTSSVREGKKG